MNKRKIPAITAQQFKKVRKQNSFLEVSAKGTSRFDSVGLSNRFSDENKGIQIAYKDKNKTKHDLFQNSMTDAKDAKEKSNIHLQEKNEDISKSLMFPVPIKEVKTDEIKTRENKINKEQEIKFATLPVTSLITQDFQRKKRLSIKNEQEIKSNGGMYAKSDKVNKLLKLKKIKYQPFNVDINSERNKDSINAQIIQNRLIYKEGFIEEDLLEFIANTNKNGYYAYLYQLMRKNLNFIDFIDIDEFNLEIEKDIDFEEKVVQSLTLKYIFMLKTFEKYENKNNKTKYVYTTENNLVIDKRSIYFWSILKNFHELAMEDKEVDELLNKEKIVEEVFV